MLSAHKELQLRLEFYKRSRHFKPRVAERVLAQAKDKGIEYVLSNVSSEARELYKGSREAICESHRAKGFLRFNEAGGILVAKAEFEHDIIECLLRHFMGRFPQKRIVIISNGEANIGENGEISKGPANEYLSSVYNKEANDELWDAFYKSQYIEPRRNRKLAMKAVPKKYWKRFGIREAVSIDKGIFEKTLFDFI
jgi:probable DNA metabolism protein